MKHAFLIIAHSYFEQLEDIISLLSSPNHYFFVNIDRKVIMGGQFIEDCKKKYPHVFFLEGKERMEVAHGGYTQVSCTLRLLHKAYDYGCDYFHLISGQDYPCHANKVFDDFFEKNRGRSYMWIDPVDFREQCMIQKYPSRVMPWYMCDFPHRENKVINFCVRGFNFISKRIYWRKPIPNLWGAWQWFSWHRSVAEYVIRAERENPKFFKRFHYTCCCDELVFSTLLHGHEEELNIDGTTALRYVNWTKKVYDRPSNPLTLNEEEYDEIMESGNFFCRKVHPDISKKLIEKLRANIKQEES